MIDSTSSRGSRKPADRPGKPYGEFPLYAHPLGYWSKKIRGTIRHFGRWGRVKDGKLTRIEGDGWEEALRLYKAQVDDLQAGRTPRVNKTGEGLTVATLCNAFLTAKTWAVQASEISAGMFAEYKVTTDRLVAVFGKARLVDDLAADDFATLRAEIAKGWGPVRLSNEITRIKGVFKYGYDNGLIDKPIRYGSEFKKPSASVLRRNKAQNGEKMLEAPAIRKLLDAAPVQLRAMLYVAVNCGFTNKDCADLPLSALDLDGGWINFPRPKTGIKRRCNLWTETLVALRAAIAERPEPQNNAAKALVFLTARGRSWITQGTANLISHAMCDLMEAAGVHRPGIGLATLRHVFRTIADGSRDQVAVNSIMGHSDGSMAAVYRERIDDSRLVAVAEHVRKWLLGDRVQ